jgi:hypothetical protein
VGIKANTSIYNTGSMMSESSDLEIYETLIEHEPEFFQRGLVVGKFAVAEYIPQEPILLLSDTSSVIQYAFEHAHLFGPVNDVYIHKLRYTDERTISFKGGVLTGVLIGTNERAQAMAKSSFKKSS